MTLKQYQNEYNSIINKMKKLDQNNDEYVQLGLTLMYLIKEHPILDKLLELKN